MADFNQFISRLQVLEGGYQNHPDDSGNYNSAGHLIGTNHGISARKLEGFLKRLPSQNDMINLSFETARQIYKSDYWDAIKADQFISQNLAELVADHGVNAGNRTAVKLLQQVLNDLSEELAIDGIVGPYTLAAVNRQSRINEAILYNAYKASRKDYYLSLNNSTFITGWLNRLNSFPDMNETDSQCEGSIDCNVLPTIQYGKDFSEQFVKDNWPLLFAALAFFGFLLVIMTKPVQ